MLFSRLPYPARGAVGSGGCSVVQGQVKRCGRCCGGFGLSFAAFAGQHLDGFGKGDVYKRQGSGSVLVLQNVNLRILRVNHDGKEAPVPGPVKGQDCLLYTS